MENGFVGSADCFVGRQATKQSADPAAPDVHFILKNGAYRPACAARGAFDPFFLRWHRPDNDPMIQRP